MPSYVPPLRDMRFVLHEVFGVADTLKAMPAHADVDAETIDAVLEEAGKFASEVLAPLNPVGDTEGCKLDPATHEVKTATGFKEAYAKYRKSGRGEKVLRHDGRRVRHYALTNHKEFFAEMTEAYFGTNDFYPFVRAELKQVDPRMYDLLEKLWGVKRGAAR